jgi:hypothetical protein
MEVYLTARLKRVRAKELRRLEERGSGGIFSTMETWSSPDDEPAPVAGGEPRAVYRALCAAAGCPGELGLIEVEASPELLVDDKPVIKHPVGYYPDESGDGSYRAMGQIDHDGFAVPSTRAARRPFPMTEQPLAGFLGIRPGGRTVVAHAVALPATIACPVRSCGRRNRVEPPRRP